MFLKVIFMLHSSLFIRNTIESNESFLFDVNFAIQFVEKYFYLLSKFIFREKYSGFVHVSRLQKTIVAEEYSVDIFGLPKNTI